MTSHLNDPNEPITYLYVMTYDTPQPEEPAPDAPTTRHLVSSLEAKSMDTLRGFFEAFGGFDVPDSTDSNQIEPVIIHSSYGLTRDFLFILDFRRKELTDPRPLKDSLEIDTMHFHAPDQDPTSVEKMKPWENDMLKAFGIPPGGDVFVDISSIPISGEALFRYMNLCKFLQYPFLTQFLAYCIAKIINGQYVEDVLKWHPTFPLDKFTVEAKEDSEPDDMDTSTDDTNQAIQPMDVSQ
jgi:hypothetical protein